MALSPFYNYSLSNFEIAKLWLKNYEWLCTEEFEKTGEPLLPWDSTEDGILNQMVYDDPKRAWKIITQIAIWLEDKTLVSDTETPDEIAGFLGAGLVEDILEENGLSIIKEAIELAGTNRYFNIALHIVDDFGYPEELVKQLSDFRDSR